MAARHFPGPGRLEKIRERAIKKGGKDKKGERRRMKYLSFPSVLLLLICDFVKKRRVEECDISIAAAAVLERPFSPIKFDGRTDELGKGILYSQP